MDAATRGVLIGAKGALAQGWTKGTLYDGVGVCLIGSLYRGGQVDFYTKWENICDGPIGKANTLLRLALGGGSLANWNDAEERTLEDVVALIDSVLLNDDAAAAEPVAEEVAV